MVNEWAMSVAKAARGKTGEKMATSIVSGIETTKVEDGIDAVRSYLRHLEI